MEFPDLERHFDSLRKDITELQNRRDKDMTDLSDRIDWLSERIDKVVDARLNAFFSNIVATIGANQVGRP